MSLPLELRVLGDHFISFTEDTCLEFVPLALALQVHISQLGGRRERGEKEEEGEGRGGRKEEGRRRKGKGRGGRREEGRREGGKERREGGRVKAQI